jgi:hypothetical protein
MAAASQASPYNRIGYVVGPYRAASRLQVECNIAEAKFVSFSMWTSGFPVICPHMNTALFDLYAPNAQDELWLSGALSIASRCDYAVCVKGYRDSHGSVAEIQQFFRESKQIYISTNTAIESETLIKNRYIS